MNKEQLEKEIKKIMMSGEFITATELARLLKKHPYQIKEILVKLENEDKVESQAMSRFVFWRWKR